MRHIRIGNDISIAWAIMTEEGNPFDLTKGKVSLYLKNYVKKERIEDFSVNENIITWTFLGKAQKNTGTYSLELVVNEQENGMVTTDACNFVNLVPCSCKVGGADDDGVKTESIELVSVLDYIASVGYDDTEIRNEIEALKTGKQDTIEDLEDIRNGAQKGATAVQKVKTINGQSIEGEGDIVIDVDLSEIEATIESNEKVTAAALTDLDARLKQSASESEAIKADIADIQTAIADGATKAELAQIDETLRSEIESNEKVTAAALNDLNGKIADLAESVIGALNTEV